jgi:hypothetical protein
MRRRGDTGVGAGAAQAQMKAILPAQSARAGLLYPPVAWRGLAGDVAVISDAIIPNIQYAHTLPGSRAWGADLTCLTRRDRQDTYRWHAVAAWTVFLFRFLGNHACTETAASCMDVGAPKDDGRSMEGSSCPDLYAFGWYLYVPRSDAGLWLDSHIQAPFDGLLTPTLHIRSGVCWLLAAGHIAKWDQWRESLPGDSADMQLAIMSIMTIVVMF